MYSILSIRPGRRNAASRRSGRLVAATTTTRFKSLTPSSSCSSCETTLDMTSLPPPPLLVTAIASISSKNTTQGDAARALRNTSCTAFSDSPTHLLKNSGPARTRATTRVHMETRTGYCETPLLAHTFHCDEIHASFRSQGFCHHGFTAAGWAIQQHALWRSDPHPVEGFWVA
jgi:hypothetical protein